MAKIIDLNQEIQERKKIDIIKKENEIDIYGWEGKIFIHFNRIVPESKKHKSLLYQIIQCVEFRKNLFQPSEVNEISEEYCKQMFINLMQRISWKGIYEESIIEELWKKIEKEVLSSKSFQYTFVRKNSNDNSNDGYFTSIDSYIFIIGKSQK